MWDPSPTLGSCTEHSTPTFQEHFFVDFYCKRAISILFVYNIACRFYFVKWVLVEDVKISLLIKKITPQTIFIVVGVRYNKPWRIACTLLLFIKLYKSPLHQQIVLFLYTPPISRSALQFAVVQGVAQRFLALSQYFFSVCISLVY